MKIELGTYYIGSEFIYEWECQHCENSSETDFSSRHVDCDYRISPHRKNMEACKKFIIRDDAHELMQRIIAMLVKHSNSL